jgi:glycosyltransferase involved in cell wall biosynthesis
VTNACDSILTVIVPIHNMAERLQNLEQTVRRSFEENLPIQFILVQDGLDHATSEEVTKLSRKFGTKYLQVDVGSPGLARNAGLEVAESEWVAFWDSDDFGFAERALFCIKEAPKSAQVIVAAYSHKLVGTDEERVVQKPADNLPSIMVNPGIWRFIFKREFICALRFKDFKMGEDQVFLADLKLKESSTYKSNVEVYRYITASAEQLTKKRDALLDIRYAIENLTNILKENTTNYRYIEVMRFRMIITALKRKIISPINAIHLFAGGRRTTYREKAKFIKSSFLILLFILTYQTK